MYKTTYFGAGHQYESALSRYEEFLENMQKYKSFKIISVSMENVRPNWQTIYITYEIDDRELKIEELEKQIKLLNQLKHDLLTNEGFYQSYKEGYLEEVNKDV